MPDEISQEEINQRQRRVSMTVIQMVQLVQLICEAKAPKPTLVSLGHDMLRRIDEEMNPQTRALYDAYRAAVPVRDGETEVDSEVSIGDDDGAYVMTWTWVSRDALHPIDPDLHIPEHLKGLDDGGWE